MQRIDFWQKRIILTIFLHQWTVIKRSWKTICKINSSMCLCLLSQYLTFRSLFFVNNKIQAQRCFSCIIYKSKSLQCVFFKTLILLDLLLCFSLQLELYSIHLLHSYGLSQWWGYFRCLINTLKFID